MSLFELPQANAAPARSAITSVESGLTDFAIIDVRRTKTEHSIRNELLSGLQLGDGKGKKMSSLLLWDEI